MGNTVASQLIRHDLPRPTLMALDQAPEEALGGLAISARLQKHINDFAIGVDWVLSG